MIEAGAALSSRHDSDLCGSHILAINNVPPQWTTRVSLARVNPTQEPGVMWALYIDQQYGFIL